MCGRYTVSKGQEVLGEFFGAEFSETHLPIYNASPGQRLPVILDAEPGKIRSVLWGIKAQWEGRSARMLINARAETVNRLPRFRDCFRQRRCLVFADGFYEWKATREGRQPYRIALKTEEPFALAGIWQETGGEPAYVILTTDSNAVTRPIHDRMPVILERREHGPWLDRDLPVPDVLNLLDPYPEGAMRAYEVSRAVNSSKKDDPDLIEPVSSSTTRSPLLFE